MILIVIEGKVDAKLCYLVRSDNMILTTIFKIKLKINK